MATELQRTANSRNATLSTGPTSAIGKRASSGNSRKHGLSGRRADVDPARAEEAAGRRARYLADLRPATLEGVEAIDVMVAMSLRIDDCREALADLAVEQAEEAATDWDHARKVDAEAIAEGLHRRPGTAAATLGATKQGVEWMLGRWGDLRRSLEAGTWGESDRSSALDLLGVGKDFRKPGQTALDAPAGRDATAHARSVIEAEMTRLRSRLETVLASADDRSRARAGSALGVLLSKPAALILRYEREAERRYNAALRIALAAPRVEAPPPDRLPAPRPPAAPAPTVVTPAPPAALAGAGLIHAATFSAAAVDPATPIRPLNRRARRAEAARLRRAGR